MKKLITLGIAAVAAGAVFAAANDVLITFSTPGTDKYADGTTVRDGEKYALCYSDDFDNFVIKADGTTTGGEIVLEAPVAKNGRCPTIVFEVDAALAAQKYSTGKWAVYLLDTRKFGESEAKVNTSGCVGMASVVTGMPTTLAGAVATTSVVADGVAVPKPQVTGIRVVDGWVWVTVKGTVPFLAYGLTEGTTPDTVTDQVDESKVGLESEDDEITFVTKAKEGGAFFKAERK